MDIEERIIKLEQMAIKMGASISVPGTMIDRALVDVKLLDRAKVAIPDAARTHPDGLRRESILVWAVGIGGLMHPKYIVWGYTISAALDAAEAAIKKSRRTRRAA